MNERIDDTAGHLNATVDDEWEYLCECADPACTERVTLTRSEYEAVRADPHRFVVCPAHQVPGIEHVVAADPEHVIVEKDGIAGVVAESLDPRR